MSTPTSNSSARISWDPPELPNGVITTYYIRVEHYDREIVEQRNISGTDLRQIEFTGLGKTVGLIMVISGEKIGHFLSMYIIMRLVFGILCIQH